MQAQHKYITAQAQMNEHLVKLTMPEGETKLPIVYSPAYNFRAPLGLHRLHPFDGTKFGRIVGMLGIEGRIMAPVALPWKFLESTHDTEYLQSLQIARRLLAALELPRCLGWIVPHFLLRRWLVETMRLHYSGTVQAAWLAMEHGWAVNLGGGFHHASRDTGHGFCIFNDISAATWSLLEGGAAERVLIVDLDAHQGDGHEADLRADVDAGRVYILDAYDPTLFPQRTDLRPWIGTEIHYSPGQTSAEFLRKLRCALVSVLDRFRPSVVFYNAGTDVLEGDPLTGLRQSAETIHARDTFVWSTCRSRGIPVIWTLSGGYQRRTADVVAESLRRCMGSVLGPSTSSESCREK